LKELKIRDRLKLIVVTKFGAGVFSREELLDAYHADILMNLSAVFFPLIIV